MIVNRDPKVRGPYTAFAEVAGAYERGRPGYPEEAVRWLVGDGPCDVVDVGAGTGKLTRSLAALGHRVTAVEPHRGGGTLGPHARTPAAGTAQHRRVMTGPRTAPGPGKHSSPDGSVPHNPGGAEPHRTAAVPGHGT